MKILAAFLVAIMLPACLMTLWYLYEQFAIFEASDPYIWVRTRGFLRMCMAISAAHVVVLGVPTYLLLRKLSVIRWWTIVGSGFVLGAVSVAVFSWPLRYQEFGASASVDGVTTMINGIPTMAGWLQYAYSVSFFGVCGAIGAFGFWVVWRK